MSIQYSVTPSGKVLAYHDNGMMEHIMPTDPRYAEAIRASTQRRAERAAQRQESQSTRPVDLCGAVVAITGTIPGMPRKQAIALIAQRGGKAYETMPAGTTLLVVASKPGKAKLDKAERWGIPTITADQLLASLAAPTITKPVIAPIQPAATAKTVTAPARPAPIKTPIIDGPATIATMAFNPLHPCDITIKGEEYAAVYTLDRAARAVTVAYYDEQGHEHFATLRAEDDFDAYCAARHTARAHYREMQQPLPERPEHDLEPIKADKRRPWIGQQIKGRGYTIDFSGYAHRTRISFSRRPSGRVIEAVKAEGFHWSPNGECWLGKLDQAHYNAAQRLTMLFDAAL